MQSQSVLVNVESTAVWEEESFSISPDFPTRTNPGYVLSEHIKQLVHVAGFSIILGESNNPPAVFLFFYFTTGS